MNKDDLLELQLELLKTIYDSINLIIESERPDGDRTKYVQAVIKLYSIPSIVGDRVKNSNDNEQTNKEQ